MNRRSFFKMVTGFVAGVLCIAKKPKLTVGKMSAKALETKRRYKALMKKIDANEKRVLAQGSKRSGTRPATEKDFQDALNEVVKDKLGKIGVETWRASGKRYYVDERFGDDKNDGLTWQTAKKNWVKIFDN